MISVYSLNKNRWITAITVLVLFAFPLVFIVGLVTLNVAGGRINTTNSQPKGLYWTVDKPVEKGDLVLFRPSVSPIFAEAVERGYASNSFFMKPVVAVTGDKVTVTMDGIYVNGMPLGNSTIHAQDGRNLPLTPCFLDNYELTTDELYLYSDYSPYSFDSRYFGVVNRKIISDVVRPVIIFDSLF